MYVLYLDLPTMKIDRNDSVDAHGLQESCHVRSGDGHSCLHLTVLTSVPVVGNHSGDLSSGGPSHGGDHEEQLHQRLVHRR